VTQKGKLFLSLLGAFLLIFLGLRRWVFRFWFTCRMFACGFALNLCFLWSYCRWVFVLHHVFVEFMIFFFSFFLMWVYGFGLVYGVSVNGCPLETDLLC
jgi:hypothetical protein